MGATRLASARFFSRPHLSIGISAAFSTSTVELGNAQYPSAPPALGPSLGCLSGQRGVGRLASRAGGDGGVTRSTSLPVPVIVTLVAHSCRLPLRAEMPATVIASPG